MTSGRVVRTPSGGLEPWLTVSVERPDGELSTVRFYPGYRIYRHLVAAGSRDCSAGAD